MMRSCWGAIWCARDDRLIGHDNDRAKSNIPGIGYTVTYAVGSTLLTVWGMVLVMLMA